MYKYLITGATGLIGSALVKRLAKDNKIVCPIRNLNKAELLFNDCKNSQNIQLIETDICEFLENLDDKFDYIIHCASPTSSQYFVNHPVETLVFGIFSTQSILNYAKDNRVRGIIYLSSLESYGTITDDNVETNEDSQGYVNPLDVRSSYNIVKRTCECLCHSYSKEYDVPVKIVRLTQTISPSIQENDMRVFAQFARLAAYGKDIELHTDGSSARQYIYIDDAVDAIIKVLEDGKVGEAYNVANEETYISARNMAEFVQYNFNPHGKVVFKMRDDMGYAPTTKIRLNTDKLKALGWRAQTDLYGMYESLIKNLKSELQ